MLALGIVGEIFENWDCGCGIVFIAASDYALNMGWWGMGGVNLVANRYA